MNLLQDKPIEHGLTTTKAPFIEQARLSHQLFIHQPYECYNGDNQEAWKKLYTLLTPKWEKYASIRFLEGVKKLNLGGDKIPHLEEVNKFLLPLTGFEAKAVSGYVPSLLFFECLRKRKFPTTITIRDKNCLDYLPEPDIFHDVAGHVPMHTDPTFANILVQFGYLCQLITKRWKPLFPQEQEKFYSNIRALSRFFWFSIEFGLIQEKNTLRVYGSGLLSSCSEIEYAVTSPLLERRPFNLEEVIHQSFEIDHFQPVLFVIDSFEHLYNQIEKLEKWFLEGKLDQVAIGKPEVAIEDFALIEE